jgi:hypothetical protein
MGRAAGCPVATGPAPCRRFSGVEAKGSTAPNAGGDQRRDPSGQCRVLPGQSGAEHQAGVQAGDVHVRVFTGQRGRGGGVQKFGGGVAAPPGHAGGLAAVGCVRPPADITPRLVVAGDCFDPSTGCEAHLAPVEILVRTARQQRLRKWHRRAGEVPSPRAARSDRRPRGFQLRRRFRWWCGGFAGTVDGQCLGFGSWVGARRSSGGRCR